MDDKLPGIDISKFMADLPDGSLPCVVAGRYPSKEQLAEAIATVMRHAIGHTAKSLELVIAGEAQESSRCCAMVAGMCIALGIVIGVSPSDLSKTIKDCIDKLSANQAPSKN